MNSKLLSALSMAVIAMIAAAPLSQAKTYTPAQFNKELVKQVGSKKGAAAYNKIASFYGSVIKDKTNKKNAAKYVSSMAKILKNTKVIPIALQGKSVNTQVNKLVNNYFQGTKFNINDSVYNQALKALLQTLITSQKTAVNSQLIYNTIRTYMVGKQKVPQATVYDAFKKTIKPLNIPPPPIS